MSKTLASQIEIDATAQEVWRVLVDLRAYPDWNPFIVQAEGHVEVGSRLRLRMQPVVGRPVTVRPTVLEVVEGRRLRWLGRAGLRGVLDAEHVFDLEERDGGGCRLHQRERFSGVLVPFLARSLDRGTLPAFAAMEEALERRVEAVAARRGA